MFYMFRNCFLKKIAIIAIIGCATFTYFTYLISFHQAAVVKTLTETQTKYVLYWSPFWTVWDYQLGYGFKPFNNCEYSNCFATSNRSLIPLEQFDALLFHVSYNETLHGVPWIRVPHQRYIITNLEALYDNFQQYNSYFNWTMSYGFDSDIVRRHGSVLKEKTDYTMPLKAMINNKTNLAAWLVTNCHTSSHREALGDELKKFMPLDVYGACGTLQCARKKGGKGNISSPKCYEMIEKKYKFYLSFENAYCKDYSTEKLYNILVKNVVPVVYGAGDYRRSAPPKSVINAADFETAGKLADYLKYLDQNVDEYLKYFKWKKHYRINLYLKTSACQLCKKLHEPIKQSIYYDLTEWWWGKNKSFCKLEKELPKIVRDLLF